VGGLTRIAGSIGIGLGKVRKSGKTGDKTDEDKDKEVCKDERWSE